MGLGALGALALKQQLRSLRAPAVLSRLGLWERIALSPEGYTLAEMHCA